VPNSDEWIRKDEPPEEVYLCLLDVLGFRSFVHGKHLRTVAKALGDAKAKSSQEIPDDVDDEHAPESLMFSDSVLFWADGEDASHLDGLARTAQSFYAALFQDGLLLRGAIVRGELSIASEGEVIVGEGLIRAYELEQGQKWGGIVLDPRLSRGGVDGLDDLHDQGVLVEHDVPWASNPSPRPHTVVCWPENCQVTREELREAFYDSFPRMAEDGRAKLAAALQFFDEYA
jgi:hypothetical protein